MAFGVMRVSSQEAYYRAGELCRALPQRVFGGTALAGIAIACAWTLYANVSSSSAENAIEARRSEMMAMQDVSAPRSDPAPALFDARFYLPQRDHLRSTAQVDEPAWWGPPVLISEELQPAAPANLRLALATPTAPGPSSIAPRTHAGRERRSVRGRRIERRQSETVAAARVEQPSIFERLFGKPPSIFEKLFGRSPANVSLAYAAPQAGVAGDGTNIISGLYDRQTAVYDISAHKLYLPDGTTLEAHSGLGSRLDDPDSADEKDRGVTPPDVYVLKPRERLFHGVRALRLIPEDQSKVFGRSGLLAHTYMLGPNGQSNGCVSIRDYDAFLHAYDNHEITRLAVVAHI